MYIFVFKASINNIFSVQPSQKSFAQQPVQQQKEAPPTELTFAPKSVQQQNQQQLQQQQQQQKQQMQPSAYFSPVSNNQPTAFASVARTLFTDGKEIRFANMYIWKNSYSRYKTIECKII